MTKPSKKAISAANDFCVAGHISSFEVPILAALLDEIVKPLREALEYVLRKPYTAETLAKCAEALQDFRMEVNDE